ncbi:MAG: glycoside hydrolase family 20 protein [Bacteroidales bacterium]|nr:glycoside hydrolase family 20 protein [Bacteroidales bacterium]
MMIKKILFIVLVAELLIGCTDRKPAPKHPDMIPLPYMVEMQSGKFTFSSKTDIIYYSEDDEVRLVAEALQSGLSEFIGKPLAIRQESGKQPGNSVSLRLDRALSRDLGNEGYKLSVRSSMIEITAPKPAGLFYGVQTIFQLLPPVFFDDPDSLAGEKPELEVPCLEMTDMPSFSWRGMHLDVSRHFFPKEFIKKYIDLIALHKMNTFHWHLTDDNGWRIEIDSYPKLTEISAWRADREGIAWNDCLPQQPGEPATYGGFYTKEEIREIVEYARQRFITIIPEIEMPGHTSEVFAAYPEFSCSGKHVPVQTGSYWPITDIFCAGKEETFVFLEHVLDEVIELFPSEYIHVGGDEADKTQWRSCPLCQSRIRKEGLSGEDELQSYFMKRIENYLNSKGRKMIGWDEILEGGLAPDATVMSWRGFEGGIEAAQQGHKVVMCPVSHCYFDYYQAEPDFQPPAIGGLTTVRKVYSFRPAPSDLKGESRKLILGGQGNLWTEYISDPSHAEYMALPRMTALAEVLWSPEKSLNWNDFRKRLQTQFIRFDGLNVNYCKGSGKVEVSSLFNKTEKSYALKLQTEASGTTIYYTLNGNKPDRRAYKYKKPIVIGHDVTLNAVAFDGDEQLERPVEYEVVYHNILGKDIIYRSEYSDRYPGNGRSTLNDGIKGSLNFNDGYWQGFYGNNADVVIDLGEDFTYKTITTTFLLDQKKWIFIPEAVNYYFSEDGARFQKIASVTHNIPLDDNIVLSNEFTIKLNKLMKVRYLRMEAINIGVCPDWHPGKGQKAWIFVDEIEVR